MKLVGSEKFLTQNASGEGSVSVDLMFGFTVHIIGSIRELLSSFPFFQMISDTRADFCSSRGNFIIISSSLGHIGKLEYVCEQKSFLLKDKTFYII